MNNDRIWCCPCLERRDQARRSSVELGNLEAEGSPPPPPIPVAIPVVVELGAGENVPYASVNSAEAGAAAVAPPSGAIAVAPFIDFHVKKAECDRNVADLPNNMVRVSKCGGAAQSCTATAE